jgi:hypothetical protein
VSESKTVVIVGSKPGASLPRGVAAYFANASIGILGHGGAPFASVVNVVSAVVLRKGRFSEDQDHADLYAAKREAICSARPSRLLLVESADHPRLGTELTDWLRESGYPSPIELLSPSHRIDAQVRLSGLRHPVVTRACIDQPLAVVMRDALHVLRHRLGLQRGEVMGKFRPSTGIVALLQAILEHGPHAEYMLVGIGLSERHLHVVRGAVVSGKIARPAVLEPHVAADTAILCALARRFVLRAEDPELASTLSGIRAASVAEAGGR